MDQTLTQILSALYQAHATIDALQTDKGALQQRIAELEAQVASVADHPKERPCSSN